jgi:Tfp pilus assembly protein PilN
MMTKKITINLIPPEIKAKRETEKNLKLLILYTIFLAAIFLAVSAYVRIGISSERAMLEALKAQNAALEAQIAQFKEFEVKKENYLRLKAIYDSLASNRISWYRFLVEIALVTPEQISLKSITGDEKSLEIHGESLQMQSVADYLIRLEELLELEDVWLDSLNVNNGKISFVIKSSIVPKGVK